MDTREYIQDCLLRRASGFQTVAFIQHLPHFLWMHIFWKLLQKVINLDVAVAGDDVSLLVEAVQELFQGICFADVGRGAAFVNTAHEVIFLLR